jgi:hypothetical protein
MEARMKPLTGKHYGTEIQVIDGDIETVINVWCSPDRTPSSRELALHGLTQQQWHDNVLISDGFGGMVSVQSSDIIDYSHFESEWQYALCERIARAINARGG